MKVLKKIDWVKRQGGPGIVDWSRKSVPKGKTRDEFQAEKEAEGWEIVGEEVGLLGELTLVMERASKRKLSDYK